MRVSRSTPLFQAVGLILLVQLFCAGPAHAIQSHGPPEGIYVHLIGHVLYGLAMIGFAIRIRLSHLSVRKSWQLMALGALILTIWNAWAFIAHVLATHVPATDFITNKQGVRMWVALHTPVDWLYYIFKMDHLLCVPAILCIYLALRRMNGTPLTSLKKQ